jgi:REP element-mobilizing transposase RayT
VYNNPYGYLLTWTCYGTWLHGDERGSIRREFKGLKWPVIESDPVLLETMRRKLKQAPYLISPEARPVILQTIREVCEHRDWYLAKQNVRTNHVHAVVNGDDKPEKMLGDLKAWCTRRLREAGIVAQDRRVWTDGGSTVYLWNTDDLAVAVDYVANRQGSDLPGS